jgi:hypothetical protein
MDSHRQHRIPVASTRVQLSNLVSEQAVDAIGHLAAALVVVTESGGLRKGSTITNSRLPPPLQRLRDICSHNFRQAYPVIMGSFGWEGFLNPTRQQPIEEALATAFTTSMKAVSSNLRQMSSAITNACAIYADKNGHHMLLSPQDIESGDLGEEAVIDFALYLAVEALLLAFHTEIPKHSSYRPLDPFALEENARTLCELLSDLEYEFKQGMKLEDFRGRSMGLLSSTGTNLSTSIYGLAVSSNGYVVYSTALLDWDNSELTDRRLATSLSVSPGPLKIDGMEGTVVRIMEDRFRSAIAGRLPSNRMDNIKLYEGGKCRLDERLGENKHDTNIVHLWRSDGFLGGRTIHVATYIEVAMRQGLIGTSQPVTVKIPTSWWLSIEAMVFADHIKGGSRCPLQLQWLAPRWETMGLLGEKLQWNSVGRGVVPGTKYVTTTSGNENLRFFEAGNLSDERRVFVRHRSASLLECIKVAMETYDYGEDWVIIA